MVDNDLVNMTSSGVEELLNRIRDEGVSEGKKRAARIIEEAENRTRKIYQDAEVEAQQLVASASEEADKLKRAGEDALRVAMRDTILDLKQQLSDHFAGQVSKIVSEGMKDEALLKRMVLEVVGRIREEAHVDEEKNIEILLPRDVIGLDELRKSPGELKEGTLSHFLLAAVGDLLRDGVTFGRMDNASDGIRINLKDRNVVIDLTDKSVADVILSHLQPRFRALLEGVVK